MEEQKLSNSIVVGGPIAVGKSTLVGALPFIAVQELETNDELQTILLRKMYEQDPIAPQIFQLDILLTRFDKYKNLANSEKMHVFDRSIFEDIFFAKKLLDKNPNVWEYYRSIWMDKVDEVVEEIGLPKLYILLTCTFETFTQRAFDRSRKAEIDNFEKNKAYFQEMIADYEKFMVEMFKIYGINYIIIPTDNMSKLEVIDFAKNELAKRGIK